jgi:uncharacterized Fe-S cluster-containing radical SAM superfamily protein
MAAYVPSSVTPSFPRTIFVEISNLCNHACAFCAYSKMTRPGRRIDFALLERLLAEAYGLGTREAAFYSGAEPFTSPDLERIIKTSKAMGYEYVFISTNGALASERRLAACFDNGLDSIKFSINGADRETYRKVHGRDHFDRVLASVEFAHDYRERSRLDYYIAVSFVTIDTEIVSNVAGKDRLQALVGAWADEVVFFDASSENGQMIGLGPMEIEAPCALPFTRLHVSAEGYLRVCCNDYQNYLALADLNHTTLAEAWNAPIFRDVRQRHLDKHLEGTLCHNCIHNVNAPIEPLVPALTVKVDRTFFEFKRPGS